MVNVGNGKRKGSTFSGFLTLTLPEAVPKKIQSAHVWGRMIFLLIICLMCTIKQELSYLLILSIHLKSKVSSSALIFKNGIKLQYFPKSHFWICILIK